MPKGKLVSLREARLAAGMSRRELGVKVGISQGLIQKIELGITPGTINTRHRLAEALHIPLRFMWPETLTEIQALLSVVKVNLGDKAETAPVVVEEKVPE